MLDFTNSQDLGAKLSQKTAEVHPYGINFLKVFDVKIHIFRNSHLKKSLNVSSQYPTQCLEQLNVLIFCLMIFASSTKKEKKNSVY